MARSGTQSSTASRRTKSDPANTLQVDRSRMIAEAAYYLAEHRGFSGGDPVKDWLDAEVLIDQMNMKTKRKSRTQ